MLDRYRATGGLWVDKVGWGPLALEIRTHSALPKRGGRPEKSNPLSSLSLSALLGSPSQTSTNYVDMTYPRIYHNIERPLNFASSLRFVSTCAFPAKMQVWTPAKRGGHYRYLLGGNIKMTCENQTTTLNVLPKLNRNFPLHLDASQVFTIAVPSHILVTVLTITILYSWSVRSIWEQ